MSFILLQRIIFARLNNILIFESNIYPIKESKKYQEKRIKYKVEEILANLLRYNRSKEENKNKYN